MGQFDKRFAARIEWTGFINQSGQDIPPFSVIQARSWQAPDPSGADSSLSATSPLIVGDLPGGAGGTATVDPNSCYVTGSGMTPAGSNGVCARPTLSTPLLAAIGGGQSDGNDSPYRLVGPVAGSWQLSRDYPGFMMLSQPQQGYALIAPAPPAQVQLYMTIAGPGTTAYPLLSSLPTVYYAQLLQGAVFPNNVGAQTLQPIQNQAVASYAYVWCDQTYLFQGTIVATLNQIVIGLVTGSSFQIGMAGTLNEPLTPGGTATASVTYIDALNNSVNDTLTVWENIGLPSGQTIASGTGVFIEWDNSLFDWVVVSAACGPNKGGQDTPIARQKSDTPISTGGTTGGF
jgi:hypothetical protein